MTDLIYSDIWAESYNGNVRIHFKVKSSVDSKKTGYYNTMSFEEFNQLDKPEDIKKYLLENSAVDFVDSIISKKKLIEFNAYHKKKVKYIFNVESLAVAEHL